MAAPNSAWQPGIDSESRKSHSNGPNGMQRVFLLRLRRLTWLRRSCAGQLDDSVLKILDKAIYSTYCDCVELGVTDEARQVLKQAA
jgi:hypothetical protein